MRITQAQRKQAAQTIKTATVKAMPPVGGLNTVSSLTDMPPEDAVILDNLYPDGSRVVTRKGYTQHYDYASALPVETLISFQNQSTSKLIAAVDGKLIDITTPSTPVVLSSLNTNDRYEYAALSNYIQIVNGVDGPYSYDGTTFATPVWTVIPNPEQFINVASYRNRLYFLKDNDSNFYYSTVNAVAGALAAFDLGNISRKGGKIVTIGTIGPQYQSGPQDYICFFMSSGEIIIYQGSDPSDAANWSLIGIWNISAVMSARSIVKIAGDIMIQARDDYYRLTEIMSSAQGLVPRSKIGPTLKDNVSLGDTKFGWQATVFQDENMVIFNAPALASTVYQHVYNIAEKAWCRYVDIPAQCWCSHNGSLYFGTSGGIVHKAQTGYNDNGAAIECDGQSSYNAFGSLDRKGVAAIRAVMKGGGEYTYNIGIDFDYKGVSVVSPVSVTSPGTPWGSPWGSPWTAVSQIDDSWHIGNGSGVDASVRVRLKALQRIEWLRTDIKLEVGNTF